MDGVMGGGSSMAPLLKTEDHHHHNTKKTTMKVYIWDMDETLILLKSLLDGTYAQSFNGSKDVQKGLEIGKMWETHILQLCDEHFFYEQIEDYNEPFLDALSKYDDGRDLSNYDFKQDGVSSPSDDPNKIKLAYRHRVIAQKYKQYVIHAIYKASFEKTRPKVLRHEFIMAWGGLLFFCGILETINVLAGLHNAFDQEKIKIWDDLYELTDNYTDRWLSSARSFLEECSVGNRDSLPCHASADGIMNSTDTKIQHVNVLVTSGSLIPSLVKCLLFRLDNLITHGNVYSSWEVGKLQCFQWIKERFSSPHVQFCVIGDGWEECEAAQTMRWPFVKIDLHPGSSHRFPGLTLKTIGHYFSVVYGIPDDAKDDEE